MKSDEHKEYIDLMKGIAMILVIATHILPLEFSTYSILSNLHNSSFYFASGILFSKTMNHVEERKTSVWDVLRKKLFRTIYPFIVWVFLYSLLEMCIVHDLNDIGVLLFYATLKAANRLWFLPVLFIAFLINCFVWRVNVKWRLSSAVWIFVIFVSALHSSVISKILFYSFLVRIGFLCADICVNHKKLILSLILYSAACYVAFSGRWEYGIMQGDSTNAGYKLFFLYVIATLGAFMMWCITWQICDYIETKHIWFLTAVGKNSIYFYIMHFVSIYCFEHMDIQSNAMMLCCFFAALLIPVLYILFLKKSCLNKYLFGVKG